MNNLVADVFVSFKEEYRRDRRVAIANFRKAYDENDSNRRTTFRKALERCCDPDVLYIAGRAIYQRDCRERQLLALRYYIRALRIMDPLSCCDPNMLGSLRISQTSAEIVYGTDSEPLKFIIKHAVAAHNYYVVELIRRHQHLPTEIDQLIADLRVTGNGFARQIHLYQRRVISSPRLYRRRLERTPRI